MINRQYSWVRVKYIDTFLLLSRINVLSLLSTVLDLKISLTNWNRVPGCFKAHTTSASTPNGPPRASCRTSSLPMPRLSKDRSICLSHELRGRPLCLLHSRLSFTVTILNAWSTYWQRPKCPGNRHHQVVDSPELPSDSTTSQVQKPPFSVHVSHPGRQSGSTSDLQVLILVRLQTSTAPNTCAEWAQNAVDQCNFLKI